MFNKKAGDTSSHTETGPGISENQKLANELHKPIARKLILILAR